MQYFVPAVAQWLKASFSDFHGRYLKVEGSSPVVSDFSQGNCSIPLCICVFRGRVVRDASFECGVHLDPGANYEMLSQQEISIDMHD